MCIWARRFPNVVLGAELLEYENVRAQLVSWEVLRGSYAELDRAQRLMSASVACRSISFNSSSLRSSRSSAATLPSSWPTLLAPITSEVIRRIAQGPDECELRERLTSTCGDVVEASHPGETVLGEHGFTHRPAGRNPRVGRYTVEIAIGEQALRQR